MIPLAFQSPDPAGQAKHRRDLDTGQPLEPLEGRCVLNRDQAPQVLADEVVERHAVRRLVALTARQRRAVALGEERQGEADDEEGRGHDRVAGAARQRERGQPKPERTPTGEPLDEAEGGPQQACDEHGGRERDQRRQEQREVALAAAARELERDEPRRGERGSIQQAEPRPGSAHRGGRDEDRGADGCDEHGEPEPLPGEDAADEDVTDRGAGALGGDRAHEHRERKPDQRPAEREHARLGDGQERELPPTRAVPGESAARRREVGT